MFIDLKLWNVEEAKVERMTETDTQEKSGNLGKFEEFSKNKNEKI